MIGSSNVLKTTIRELTAACGAKETAADILTLGAFVLMIETIGLKSLWETVQSYLLELLTNIESDSNALITARLALQEGKPEELSDQLDSLLEKLNINPEGLKNDLQAIGKMAETIYDSCTIETPSGAEINVVA